MNWIEIKRIEDVPQGCVMPLFDRKNERQVFGSLEMIESIDKIGFVINEDIHLYNPSDADAAKESQEAIEITHYIPAIPDPVV